MNCRTHSQVKANELLLQPMRSADSICRENRRFSSVFKFCQIFRSSVLSEWNSLNLQCPASKRSHRVFVPASMRFCYFRFTSDVYVCASKQATHEVRLLSMPSPAINDRGFDVGFGAFEVLARKLR